MTADLPRDPVVRRARRAEVRRLALLEEAGFDEPWSAESLAREIEGPHTLVLVAAARRGDPPAGFAAYRLVPGGEEAELLRLAVEPAARRQGLARALLDEGRRRLAEAGCERCFLEVRADNRAALALYDATGFHRIGRRAGYYGPGA
ncbi:MAG TPA: GNAT family N-acetyltransferase, partial [Thermoanaerobaculia bacterium]|nr:GNAT family N-acetyltransferase [Thermoanaerobaculia bacterium]